MRANTALIAALLLMVGNATAATPTVADLDAVQAETIMARAKANKAKADQELRGYAVSVTGGADGANAQQETQLPTARGLFGANGKSYVVFQYANGGMAEGVVGQVIPGNFKVIGFDSTGVDLRAPNGRRQRIPFSMQAPATSATAPGASPARSGFTVPSPVLPVPPLR